MTRTDRRSLWYDGVTLPSFAPLTEDLEVDVAVVGAGITGLTLASLLQEDGRSVAVLERDRIGSGVTGRTTGHLATSPDADVSSLVEAFGEARARQVVSAMTLAVDAIEETATALGIDCDLRRTHGVLYAARAEDRAYVERELEASAALGMPVRWVEGAAVGLPYEVPGAMRIEGQARFHPLKYLGGLAEAVAARGVRVFERTRVERWDGGDAPTAYTATGHRVRARDLVFATHTPQGVDPLHTAVAPYRSYVVAFRPNGPPPEGLFWDSEDPYHYVRPQGDLVLVGGNDHKTGSGNPTAAYDALERWVHARFDVAEVTHRWSAQVYEPVDGLPFVGLRATHPHLWVATGYSGDGLVWGTAAAHVLAARLRGLEHPYAAAIDARRIDLKAGGGRFLKENVEVAKHFVADRVRATGEPSLRDVAPGEGKVLRRKGKALAVHRDLDGALHVCDAVCPHLKCLVQWNDAETSWDCPCHGARYDVDGVVIEGPSSRDLGKPSVDVTDDPPRAS